MISFRHAVRSLERTPLFAITAIVTLGLGIGAVAATFAIVYGVLLAPLHFGQPERLVSVALEARGAAPNRLAQPPALYFTYKRLSRRIEDIGLYRIGNANLWTPGDDVASERVTATWVTASMIPLLQVPPLLGRSFTEDETQGHGPSAVILSESMWRTRFHGDRGIIGKSFMVNSIPRQVIGVMPERFSFPSPETRLWLPVRSDPASTIAGDFSYSAVARLASGATPEELQRELATIVPRMAESHPRLESGTATAGWIEEMKPAPVVVPLRDEMTRGIARTLWMLASAAGLVLLVAWANVANLMLIRADGRQLELAVREALGAGPRRILTHFLGESLVLSAIAAAIGLGEAAVAVRALVAFGPAEIPRLSDVETGMTTAGVVGIVAVIGAIVCSAVPVFRIRRGTLSISLRDGGRADTAGRTRQRLRSAIGALQIAVALVVLACSALLLRTFRQLYADPPGFEAANVMTIWTQLPFARYGDSSSVNFYARLAEAVRRLPGVRSVGLTSRLPLGDGQPMQLSLSVQDDGPTVALPAQAVDDGYFATMRIPFLAGRGFDRLGVQRSGDLVISRRVATTLWNDPTGGVAIGKRLALAPSGLAYTVIGVVDDVRDQELGRAPSPLIYMPQAAPRDGSGEPTARRTMALVVRTSGPPSTITGAVRSAARDLDPTVPIFNVEAMSDVVRASTARLSLALTLMSTAALITLILATIGLYGLIANMVTLRTRELGIRVALGADPRKLAGAVVRRGLVLTTAGVAAGLALYAITTPFLEGFLYRVTPTDPLSLVGASLALIATAALASWIPARRAAQVDPAEALRAD